MNNIYILTGEIQTGKTTALELWLSGRKNSGGILCPVIGGKRYLESVSSGEKQLLETDNDDAHIIGRYKFSKEIFKWAQTELMSTLKNDNEWIIIDEIGPLELEEKGLEPAAGNIIRSETENCKLLLVVRDKLLHEVIAHYGISNAVIINKEELTQL